MIFLLTSNLGGPINFQSYVWVLFDLNEHKLQVSWINNETTSIFIPLILNAIKLSSKKKNCVKQGVHDLLCKFLPLLS